MVYTGNTILYNLFLHLAYHAISDRTIFQTMIFNDYIKYHCDIFIFSHFEHSIGFHFYLFFFLTE